MVRRKISRKGHPSVKIALWIVFAAIVAALFIFFRIYRMVFSPVVTADEDYLYIPTGASYENVLDVLEAKQILSDRKDFEWLAEKKGYPSAVKPGRYRVSKGMNNNSLVNMLRSGAQEPLMVQFNNIRTLPELAGRIARQIEPDSLSLLHHFMDPSTAGSYGFTREAFPAMFIPNSYEFFWNTGSEKFTDRMKREYDAFWNQSRKEKAKKIGLSLIEVNVLASLVEQESLHNDENARIAGVFINRIKEGIPLQSDPTVIFAWQDFSIRRVLNKHKVIDSPYNTYRNRGLPPGPICIPSISAIESVLNYEKHNYLYFCAKPDFSGYHNFAKTLSQHNQNARLYQQALNRRKIYR